MIPAQERPFFDKARLMAWVIGTLGTFLIGALLVLAMRHYAQPAPVGAARVEERYKFLREQRAADAKILNEYDWQDKDKGIVRIPIQRWRSGSTRPRPARI